MTLLNNLFTVTVLTGASRIASFVAERSSVVANKTQETAAKVLTTVNEGKASNADDSVGIRGAVQFIDGTYYTFITSADKNQTPDFVVKIQLLIGGLSKRISNNGDISFVRRATVEINRIPYFLVYIGQLNKLVVVDDATYWNF